MGNFWVHLGTFGYVVVTGDPDHHVMQCHTMQYQHSISENILYSRNLYFDSHFLGTFLGMFCVFLGTF